MEKLAEILKSWKKRKLTIFGKVLVLKVLALSQVIFNATVLPIPFGTIGKINEIIYQYLWDGKRDKIKRKTLIGDYERGGIRMPDVQSVFESLQVKWIQRLVSAEEATWKELPKFWLNQFGKDFLIFKMNIGNLSQIHCKKHWFPKFYEQIVNSWYKVRGVNKVENMFEIRKEVIWGNRYILFKNKPIIFHNWIEDNVIYVNDLLNEKGNFSQKDLYNKLSKKINWLSEISTLLKAIPQHWKQILNSDESQKTSVHVKDALSIATAKLQKVYMKDIKNNLFYEILVQRKFEKSYIENMWNRKLKNSEKGIWKYVWLFIHKGLTENKIRQFKYKILHYILPCGELLHKWKIQQTAECIFCGKIDDYQHMYCQCNRLNFLWAKIKQAFLYMGISNLEISPKTLIFGYKIQQTDYYWVNKILTLCFFSLFKSYCMTREKKVDVYILLKKEIEHRVQTTEKCDKKLYVVLSKFFETL